MIEDKWNLSNLPPKGHADVAEFAYLMFEIARHEKERLKKNESFLNNYSLYRGAGTKQQRSGRIGFSPSKKNMTPVNLYFANIERTVSNITARNPTGEVVDLDGLNDGSEEILTGALKKWWKDTDQQTKTRITARNMELYGVTLEKPVFDQDTKTPNINIVDPFAVFPCPGYWEDIGVESPYIAFLYIDYVSQIENRYNVKDIASDDAYDLLGMVREDFKPPTLMGGAGTVGNYADPMTVRDTGTTQQGTGGKVVERGMIIELWIRDKRMVKKTMNKPLGEFMEMAGEPLPESQNGMIAVDDNGQPLHVIATTEEAVYPDGIRKITISRSKSEQNKAGWVVLDDSANPNINPALEKELSANTYPWGRLPVYYSNSYRDPISIWGFAAAEQVSDLIEKINQIITKLIAYVLNVMAPPLIVQKHCGITKEMIESNIEKSGRLILMPTVPNARIEFLQIPNLPQTFFQTLDLVIRLFDRVYQIEDADRGIAPKGVVAASAIVALQERNQVLMQTKTAAIDFLAEQRSKWAIGMWQNWGTVPEFVNVAGSPVEFSGVEYAGRKFNYVVESGSTTPRTSLQIQEMAKWLYQVKAIGQRGLLEAINWPNWKEELERTAESQLDQALQILVQSGMPEEAAAMLRQQLLASSMQFAENETRKSNQQAEAASGASGARPPQAVTG